MSCFTFRSLVTLIVFSFASILSPTQAQTTHGQYQSGTFDPLGPDTIDVGSLNTMLTIPVLHKAGRANTNFTYDLSYNGSIWTGITNSWVPDQNWGWSGQTEVLTGYVAERQTNSFCQNHGRFPQFQIAGVAYHDAAGIVHRFAGVIRDSDGQCTTDTDTLSNTWSTDHLYYIGDGGYPITSQKGVVYDPPINTRTGSASYTDANGNQITTDGSGHFTDTTGNTALTLTGGAPSNQVYSYTDSTGANRSVTVSYVNYSVATNFGCSNITEFSASSVSLVDTITLADSTTYHFTYEATPGISGKVTGRIATITIPAGGVITYTYTGANNSVNCADGSPWA